MAIAASPRSGADFGPRPAAPLDARLGLKYPDPARRHKPDTGGAVELHHVSDSLLRSMIAAHEEERRRLARDLHDVVGQALMAVRLNLESLRRSSTDRRTHTELRRSIATVDQAMRDLRDIAIDLRPAILDDLGLVAAARWYVARQGRLAGYRTNFAAESTSLELDDDVASACFRALQEALTNVARHAGANRVRVELRHAEGDVELIVDDDGVGFDPMRISRGHGRRPTLGLRGMSERVATVGGSLEITSAPGIGTRIRARFPRAKQDRRPDDR